MVDAGSSTEAMAAATVVAAAAPRLARSLSPGQPRTAAPASRAPVRRETAQAQVAVVDGMLGTGIPQPDIVTRPWPRSVLPQYASGGLAVGFGEHARGAVGYNPFQAQSGIGDLPPVADGNAGGHDREAVPAPSPAAVDAMLANIQSAAAQPQPSRNRWLGPLALTLIAAAPLAACDPAEAGSGSATP